jgi:hypothetical protein
MPRRRSKPLNLFADIAELSARAQAQRATPALPSPKRRKRASKPDDKPSNSGFVVTVPITIPTNRRLGFRPAEFAALTGVSPVTIWRGIKSGKIKTIDHCGIKIVPRAFAIERGFITESDAI